MSRRLRTVLIGVLPALGLTLVAPGPAVAAKSAADVALHLSGPGSRAYPAQPFFVSVEMSNAGPDAATGVTAVVRLPAGLTVVSGASCVPDGTGSACTIGPTNLPAGFGAAGMLAIVAQAAGTYTVSGTVTANEPDPDPADNAASVAITVVAQTEADVSLQLPTDLTAYAGESFAVQVSMSNAGPAPATGVTAVLRVPAGLAAESGASCLPDGTGSVCTLGPTSIPPGAGLATLIRLVAASAGTYTMTGTVTANEPDPDPADNTVATAITIVSSADVSVDVAGPAASAPSKAVTYTVTVANDGPSPAANVTLIDAWTASVTGGVRLLSVVTTQGTCTPASGAVTCELGGLADGAAATVTVVLRPRGVGSITDEARVMASDDPNPANNVDAETTVIG